MKPQKITEKQFMSQVIQLAKLLGWLVYHTHDSRRSMAGFPDLLMLKGSSLIAAELKVGSNEPTAEQRAWLIAFASAGADAFIWKPSEWEEIEAALGAPAQGTS